ncbi:glycoside hydrolase family 1 protein [bacterium]|nr:glycoside hydrolase family 1 protein [bacterium]
MKFLWGAATSSHQIEGYNTKNDWWAWEQAGHIEGSVTSGPATDHRNRYQEDLRLAKELGLNAYRFSIEWSRVEPEEGCWDLDALDWYAEVLAECEKLKLLPMVTLHHFTSPQWFSAMGDFTAENAGIKFKNYVKKIVQVLGDRIPLWCTVNEPVIMCVGKYLAGFQPPAIYQPEKCSQLFRGLLKAHVSAYDCIHSEVSHRRGPWRHRPLMVGYAHNMMDFVPARHWHPMERLLTFVARNFYNQSWLDATTGKRPQFGIAGMVPQVPEVPEALGRLTTDFVGINYYSKAILRWRARGEQFETAPGFMFGVGFSDPGEPISEMGWGFHPSGLGRMIRFVKNYRLPIFITENGIADGADAFREDYMFTHLKEVAREIKAGADVRGYFYWSLLDNFEWVKGFKPRFGLIAVDYSNFSRVPRPSAEMYRAWIEAHQAGYAPPEEAILQGVFDKYLKNKK